MNNTTAGNAYHWTHNAPVSPLRVLAGRLSTDGVGASSALLIRHARLRPSLHASAIAWIACVGVCVSVLVLSRSHAPTLRSEMLGRHGVGGGLGGGLALRIHGHLDRPGHRASGAPGPHHLLLLAEEGLCLGGRLLARLLHGVSGLEHVIKHLTRVGDASRRVRATRHATCGGSCVRVAVKNDRA